MTANLPYTVRRTTRTVNRRQRQAEILTFTGSTEEEYDAFRDARSERGESLGYITGQRAKQGELTSGNLVWLQWVRLLDDC